MSGLGPIQRRSDNLWHMTTRSDNFNPDHWVPSAHKQEWNIHNEVSPIQARFFGEQNVEYLKAVLWNSGKFKTDNNNLRPYMSQAFAANKAYYLGTDHENFNTYIEEHLKQLNSKTISIVLQRLRINKISYLNYVQNRSRLYHPDIVNNNMLSDGNDKLRYQSMIHPYYDTLGQPYDNPPPAWWP